MTFSLPPHKRYGDEPSRPFVPLAALVDDARMRVARLTAQQEALLKLIAQNQSAKEIARKIDIEVATANTRTKAVLHKLGARNKLEAAVMAVRAGVV